MTDAPEPDGQSALPPTRESLVGDLLRLGLQSGDTVLVHSSLRTLGWVVGGSVAVVQALQDAIGPTGTVIVPTQTSDNSDPADWQHPPVPQAWWPVIREHTPGFDPRIAPSRFMGAVAECVRTWPKAHRSNHPSTSFAGVGARAGDLLAVHDLDSACGERSPLAALEAADARVLFLGTGWGTCTTFHLAEYRQPDPARSTSGFRVLTAEGSTWVQVDDVDLQEADFPQLGAAFETSGAVIEGKVAAADCRLFSLAAAVSFATQWMGEHRTRVAPEPAS